MKLFSLILLLILSLSFTLIAFGDLPKYEIDAEKCIGCNLCVDTCPTGAIEIVDGKAVIDAEKCIGCGICEDGDKKDYPGCPTKAISKIEKKEVTEVEVKEIIEEKKETTKDSTMKVEKFKLTPCGKKVHCK